MVYNLPTRYEAFTLKIVVRTYKPENIHVTVQDADQKNTVFTDRSMPINGNDYFLVRMPVTGKNATITIYNDNNKALMNGKDSTFDVISIEKVPLLRKLDFIDFNDPKLQTFVNFCTQFCFNAGVLDTGMYQSELFWDNKANKWDRFYIDYVPFIVSSRTQKELNTPARIEKHSSVIQVSKKKILPMTFPMRMAIMFHEFSHNYVNDNMNDEVEADLNGLLIYLGLGYPRIEAYDAYLTTFEGADTQLNRRRYDILNRFIKEFEQNFFMVR